MKCRNYSLSYIVQYVRMQDSPDSYVYRFVSDYTNCLSKKNLFLAFDVYIHLFVCVVYKKMMSFTFPVSFHIKKQTILHS